MSCAELAAVVHVSKNRAGRIKVDARRTESFEGARACEKPPARGRRGGEVEVERGRLGRAPKQASPASRSGAPPSTSQIRLDGVKSTSSHILDSSFAARRAWKYA